MEKKSFGLLCLVSLFSALQAEPTLLTPDQLLNKDFDVTNLITTYQGRSSLCVGAFLLALTYHGIKDFSAGNDLSSILHLTKERLFTLKDKKLSAKILRTTFWLLITQQLADGANTLRKKFSSLQAVQEASGISNEELDQSLERLSETLDTAQARQETAERVDQVATTISLAESVMPTEAEVEAEEEQCIVHVPEQDIIAIITTMNLVDAQQFAQATQQLAERINMMNEKLGALDLGAEKAYQASLARIQAEQKIVLALAEQDSKIRALNAKLANCKLKK